MKTPPDLSRLIAAQGDNDNHAAFMAMHAERFDAYRTRHEDGTAPRAVSAFQLFQTPQALAARMVELARPRPGLDWLEPSAGLGRILRPIMATAPGSVTACEENTELAGELFRTFPGLIIGQGDFLDRKPSYEGNASLVLKPFANGPVHFDRIVMNPPFHMRADIRHIIHALRFLAPGGSLVALCMATHHRETALRDLADHWETLPASTFVREGTKVETYLLRIINHV